MLFRQAHIRDTEQMQIVRNAVKENVLSDPSLVPDEAYADFLNERGRGWLCEIENKVAGFCIVDLQQNNVWALFVHPEKEGMGIAKKLQQFMLAWYFSKTKKTLWLGTAPGTRAQRFYISTGWLPAGTVNKGEVKFEMSYERWLGSKK